ncbi:MAG: hypothetical protein ACTSWY_11315 [Promethearchaeota archaeon]
MSENQKDKKGSPHVKGTGQKIKRKKRKGKKTKATRASIIFYYIIMGSAVILALGSVWAILDLIQPEGKWEWFVSLFSSNPGLQIVIIGALGMLVFVLFFCIFAFFKRGNRMIYKLLYPDIKREKVTKDNSYAKIISGGLLISVFVIFTGIILVILQELFLGGDSLGLSIFFTLPNGLKIMLISLLVSVLTILIIIFVWIWENGYNFTLIKIIKYNKPTEEEYNYSKIQLAVTYTILIIILISVILLCFGAIWGIGDFVTENKFELFLGSNWALQFSIIGSLASLLFFLLIMGLVFFQRGKDLIFKFLFVKKIVTEEIPANKAAKFITIGFLVWIIGLLIGFVIIVIQNLIILASGGSGSMLEFFIELTGGLRIILIGGLLLGSIWSLIGLWSFAQNGYYFTLTKIIKARESISGEYQDEDEEENEEYDE